MFVCNAVGQTAFPINLSPDGIFDNVYDQQGNRFNLSDLLIGTNNASTTSRSALISCSTTSYFNLFFESGCGMDSATDLTQIARRNVICKVFEDISNFINSPLTSTGNKVNIWVRNFANVPSGASTIGMASAYNVFPSTTLPIGGIVDNEIWKTIHTGVDSYANVVAPLIPNSATTGTPGLFYHGMITFRFTGTTVWNTNLAIATPAGSSDLYSVALHEITHALGFSTAINNIGNSVYGSFKYFNRYDLFLRNNANLPLLANTGACGTMYNYNFVLNSNILQPPNSPIGSCLDNSTNCNNAIKFAGSSYIVPVFTPNCFIAGSSLSHFEDMCVTNPATGLPYPNDSYFVMSNASLTGTNKRYLKSEERAALCDMGYSVKTTFGSSNTLNSFYNYGGTACGGITVAGINDGMSVGNTYTYIGNQSTNIAISGANILGNDLNATSFECLEDITATSNLSVTSGTTATTISFNSAISGMHILRYVPKNTAGIRGNITYIYVFVKIPTFSSCSPNPTICSLVMNGNFEQNSGIPTAGGQIIRGCGWTKNGSGTPDYFYQNTTYPDYNVPSNAFGNEPDNVSGNKGYAGYFIYNNPFYANPDSNTSGEVISTQLSAPLAASTNYQVSFDVSLSDNAVDSGNIFKQQMLLTSTAIPPNSLWFVPDAQVNSGIFRTNATYSSIKNGWERITFDITTTTGGEKFLYLGALNDVPFITTNLNASDRSYYYIDNVNITAVQGSFNLPTSISCGSTMPNLAFYLNGIPTNGFFSGPGVTVSGGIYSLNTTTLSGGVQNISYTYTNNSGCMITLTKSITVMPVVTTFTFSFLSTLCSGSTAPTLPTTSDNGVTGTWFPATVSNTVTANYTFKPDNLCASAVTKTITVVNCNSTVTTCTAPSNVYSYSGVCYQTTPQNTTTSLFSASWECNTGASGLLINGVPATAANTTISPAGPMPIGITLNPNGTMNVAPNAALGRYTFYITACQLGTSSCVIIRANITVQKTIIAFDDVFGMSLNGNLLDYYAGAACNSSNCYGLGSVLFNDNICNGTLINSSNVILTSSPLPNLQINTSAGAQFGKLQKIGSAPLVANNASNPFYSLSYTICDASNLSMCETRNVKVIVYNQTTRMANPDLIKDNTEAIDYFDAIIIYPNPSDGLYFINFKDNLQKDVNIELYNFIGQKIFDINETVTNQYLLNLNNYSTGTYLVKIFDGNETVMRKIIKQ